MAWHHDASLSALCHQWVLWGEGERGEGVRSGPTSSSLVGHSHAVLDADVPFRGVGYEGNGLQGRSDQMKHGVTYQKYIMIQAQNHSNHIVYAIFKDW